MCQFRCHTGTRDALYQIHSLQTLGNDLEQVGDPVRLAVVGRDPTANDDSAVRRRMSELGLESFASNVDPVDVDAFGRFLGKDLVRVVGFVCIQARGRDELIDDKKEEMHEIHNAHS